jgi:Fe-Mn family superoxide dismutase
MAHELPKLPYPYESLEPYIDTTTMQIHHDKHHAAYVTNLNNALNGAAADIAGMSAMDLIKNLSKVPEAIRGAVRNNAGGHVNHTMFWEQLKVGVAEPSSGALADAINGAFGSMAALKEAFEKAGLGRFGSGWAWLVKKEGKLTIVSTPNQDNPVMDGPAAGTPILGVDVWEHAYYLKYQNRRADYLKAFWNVVNWDDVAARFAAAK